MKRNLSMAVLLLSGSVAAAATGELNVGDAAPKLVVKEFVKGKPVKSFDKGKIYVVEFWATWCGPCRVSIPHLTELQKKNKDVAFIGVSVWERQPEKVKPFVENMGDKMDYRVAADSENTMAETWMKAAGQNGIPTAFIINGDGKVAWIGHPMSMEEPLDKIIAGKWDLEAAARKFKDEAVVKRKMQKVQEKLVQARGDTKEMLAVIDQAISDDAKLEEQLGMYKFMLLRKSEQTDKALEYGKHLVETVFADNAQGLNFVAWGLVDPAVKDKPNARMAKLAVQAAQRADELLKHKDGSVADTLARAYFVSGDTARAVETQERAVKLAQGTPLEKQLKPRLEEYRKAATKEEK